MFAVSHTFVCVQRMFCVSRATFSVKSPSSNVQRQSAPTKASSLPFSWKVTVFVSPGCNSIFVNWRRRRLSGTIEATRSLL